MMDVKQEPLEPPVDEIYELKQEIIECEELKLEERSELLIKIDQDYVGEYEYEYLQNAPIHIKKEIKITDSYVDVDDIKQEPEFVQLKSESELLASLTTHCDLLTLKDESTAHPSYLDLPSNKQAESKSKSLKNARILLYKRKRMYTCPVIQNRLRNSSEAGSGQLVLYKCGLVNGMRNPKIHNHRKKNAFRSSRKTPFGAQFGRCYELCYYCGQFFFTKSQLLFHFIASHYVKKVTTFCKRNFAQYKHCRCKNCLDTTFRNPLTVNMPHSNENKCEIGSKRITTERNLNNQCQICLKQFSNKNSLKKHSKIHAGEKLFECEMCSKQFAQKENLKRHSKIHTGEKPIKCEICSKRFIQKSDYKNHFRVHNGERPFKCEICSKQFAQKINLKTHLKIHTRDKLFECKICLNQFIKKCDFKKHLKIHIGEKPFKCEICSKQFTQKGSLHTHLKIHTGDKPFKCEICLERFFQAVNLKKHFKSHTGEKPFKCEICSKRFIQKSDIKNHFKIHTGEKPFKCKICSKQFTQKINLNTHLKIHTREKFFECEICLKQFVREVNFKKHFKIHTGEKLLNTDLKHH